MITGNYEDINESAILAEELKDKGSLMEAFLLSDLGRLDDETKASVLESTEMQVMINEGMIAKNSIVRLSKEDDLFRRTKIVSIQMAKEKNDRLYNDVIKYRTKERQAMGLILKKYGGKAGRIARIDQKEYLKTSPISTRIIAGPKNLNSKKLFDAKTGMMKRVSTVNEE